MSQLLNRYRPGLRWIVGLPVRDHHGDNVNVVYPAGSSHAQHIIKLVSEDCKSSGFSVVGVPTEVYTGEILSSSHAQAALLAQQELLARVVHSIVQVALLD